MKKLKLNHSLVTIPDDIRGKLDELDISERQKIIDNNIEVVNMPDGREISVLLMSVEDDKLVSKKDLPLEEKQDIAEKQILSMEERMSDPEFKRNYILQLKTACKFQKDILIESGKTPIQVGKSSIYVLDIPNTEFKVIVITIINIIISIALHNYIDVFENIQLKMVKLNIITLLCNVTALTSCAITDLAVIVNKKKIRG